METELWNFLRLIFLGVKKAAIIPVNKIKIAIIIRTILLFFIILYINIIYTIKSYFHPKNSDIIIYNYI